MTIFFAFFSLPPKFPLTHIDPPKTIMLVSPLLPHPFGGVRVVPLPSTALDQSISMMIILISVCPQLGIQVYTCYHNPCLNEGMQYP